jgi:hypothetical protein
MAFLGEIKRTHKIPISITFDATPTGTPTYRIITAAQVEIVAATNLSGSGLLWYKDDQTVGSSDAEGEYLVEYTAVIDGVTRYATDSYEVPPISLIASGEAGSSGSSDWTQTRDNMIQQILEKTILAEGETANADQKVLVSRELNQYVKWLGVVHDVKLWKLEMDHKKFSAPDEVTGTDSLVYTCIRSHTSSSDNKPVTGDDWMGYWKQTGSTGGVWATSTAYYSTGDFTDATDLIGIERAYIRKNNIDREVEVVSGREYSKVSNKTYFGDPIMIYFDKRLSPTIFLHPQVEDYDDVTLFYEKIMRIEDFDVAGNTPDFPTHWIAPIVWNVAYDVGIIYDLAPSKLALLKRRADEYLAGVLDSNTEYSEFMRIIPNRRR